MGRLTSCAAAAAFFFFAGGTAHAEPLDRVVAIVNEKPVFLSELRERARPFEERAAAAGTPTTGLRKEVLEQMITERIEADEAEKLHIRVETSETEAALKTVAAQLKMSVPELLEEVKKQKLTEADYRAEVDRQILEGKLIQLRVRGRVKVTEADAQKVYEKWAKEASPVDLRIIGLRLGKDGAERKTKETLAAQIVTQARSGTDFCALVQKHSDDTPTKSACGSRGPMPRDALVGSIAKAATSLAPGQVAEPVLFPDASAPEAVLVIQRAPGKVPPVPSFVSVKQQMMDRAMLEATERERKVWLDGLRKTASIDVRL